MALVSTSAKISEDKVEKPIKSQVYYASQEKVNAVAVFAEVNKQAVLDAEVAKVAKIAKEKDDELALEKAKKDELDKQAANKIKEVAKAKALAAKQAEDSRLAKIAAEKAKQAEIDRIAADRADKVKQAEIAEQYRIAKLASDKAAAEKEAKKETEIDRLKAAKVLAIKLANEAASKLTKDEAAGKLLIEADKLAKTAADLQVKTATDKITNAEAAGTAVTEADRLGKETAEKLAKAAADKLTKDEAASKLLISADKLAKAAADKTVREATDKLAAAEVGSYQTVTGAKLAAYLSSEANICDVLVRAVELHYGDPSNTCVYFSSEAMRRIGVMGLDTDWICNTGQYLNWLTAHSWVSSFNIKALTPGSICFTTNNGWTKKPTHTFAFMGWVKSGDYTRAYVVDNQDNKIHERSMLATNSTDAFAFFMHN